MVAKQGGMSSVCSPGQERTLRRRPSDHFLPGISDLHRVLSLTHVTCHSFQVSVDECHHHPRIRCSEQDTGYIQDLGRSKVLGQEDADGG